MTDHPVIDAHQHCWQIARGDYAWLDDSVAPIRRDFDPADWSAVAGPLGVARSVLVQAAPSLDETAYLLRLAAATPSIGAVVGWVDLASDDAPAHLGLIASEPALRGVRPMLQDIEETEWILRSEVIDALRVAARLDLTLDALVQPRHLAALERLGREVPELAIVVDHCAKPHIEGGRDPGDEWREGMSRLAANPRMHCKLSGLANEHGPGWSAASLRPVTAHVLETFGAERVMWGSDWPVLELVGDYAAWLDCARELLDGLGADGRDAVLARTAARFYRIGPPGDA